MSGSEKYSFIPSFENNDSVKEYKQIYLIVLENTVLFLKSILKVYFYECIARINLESHQTKRVLT